MNVILFDTNRANYYPLSVTNAHFYDTSYVVGQFEIYQKVTTAENPALIQADAYVYPQDSTSYSVGGTWVKLEENMDYEIDRILGYIRMNSVQNAIAIAYTTTSFDPNNQSFDAVQDTTNGTNFKSVYDECVESSTDYQEECKGLITLKLLKDINPSTPNSPTWSLMFKNVYSLGGSNIESSGLELDIVRDLGGGDERTHSETGTSYLSIFGLDSENENHQKVDGGDGKIDLYGSLLNLAYGELILPTYLPFAYDTSGQWGINHSDLQGVLEVELNDADGDFSDDGDTGPAMYYDTNQDDINAQHEFVIKVKTSSISSSMSLGFMIVEGSETVKLGGSVLQKDIDYTIDYFSGTINFINPAALDPTASISVSYEENEFIFENLIIVEINSDYIVVSPNEGEEHEVYLTGQIKPREGNY
mgnify:CR=1 FL=1